MAKSLIKLLFAEKNLIKMTRTGRNGMDAIPTNVYNVVETFVRKKVVKECRIYSKEIDRSVTVMLNTLRRQKEKNEKGKNRNLSDEKSEAFRKREDKVRRILKAQYVASKSSKDHSSTDMHYKLKTKEKKKQENLTGINQHGRQILRSDEETDQEFSNRDDNRRNGNENEETNGEDKQYEKYTRRESATQMPFQKSTILVEKIRDECKTDDHEKEEKVEINKDTTFKQEEQIMERIRLLQEEREIEMIRKNREAFATILRSEIARCRNWKIDEEFRKQEENIKDSREEDEAKKRNAEKRKETKSGNENEITEQSDSNNLTIVEKNGQGQEDLRKKLERKSMQRSGGAVEKEEQKGNKETENNVEQDIGNVNKEGREQSKKNYLEGHKDGQEIKGKETHKTRQEREVQRKRRVELEKDKERQEREKDKRRWESEEANRKRIEKEGKLSKMEERRKKSTALPQRDQENNKNKRNKESYAKEELQCSNGKRVYNETSRHKSSNYDENIKKRRKEGRGRQ